MCRYLMVRSDAAIGPASLIEPFAEMSRITPAPDGDPQADGWGFAWIDASGRWNLRRFPDPIWESSARFGEFPESRCFCVHARSASSPELKNNVEFNQPFVEEGHAFVFNGFLQGIALPYPVPGRIGSQKIWSLLRARLTRDGAVESLGQLTGFLNRHSRRVQAMNIGLTDGRFLYGLNQYADHEEYYRCRVHVSPGLRMICSGSLDGFDFQPAPLRRAFAL